MKEGLGTEGSFLDGFGGRLTAFDGSGEGRARSGGMEGARSSDSGESREYVVSKGRAIAVPSDPSGCILAH